MMFTEKQLKVLKNANKRWNILSGATRSGKTHITYFLIPMRLLEHKDNNKMLIGKTINTLRRNILDPMRELFGKSQISQIIDKQYCYLFGQKVYVVGANDERAITKIQGVGLGYAYCDEITTYPQNFVEMLKSRLDKHNSRCDATCNPTSPSHFIKEMIDDKTLDLYNEEFSIYDNSFLSEEFIKNLEAEYTGTIYFDRWILGKWVKAEGLVFPVFKRDKHFMTYEEYVKRYGSYRIQYIILGGDGATTNDATAFVPLAILENGQGVVLDIFYHDPKKCGQLSNQQLMEPIARYLHDLDKKYKLSEQGVEKYAYIDSASADLVLSFQYHFGHEYMTQRFTKKNIIQTSDTLNNAFARGAVHILDFGGYKDYKRNRWEKGLSPLVKELEEMTWSKSNQRYDDSIANDCADALRYAVAAYYTSQDNLWSVEDKYYN